MVTEKAPDIANKNINPRFYIGPLHCIHHGSALLVALALRLHLYKSFASHSRQQGSEYNVGNCVQLDQNTNQAFSGHFYQDQAETQIKFVFILVRKQEHLVYHIERH